jgi:hypothetical protein
MGSAGLRAVGSDATPQLAAVDCEGGIFSSGNREKKTYHREEIKGPSFRGERERPSNVGHERPSPAT